MNIKENIQRLLDDESISNYAIHKETGVAQSTLSDIKTGKSELGNMRLDVAIKLNEYYKEMDKVEKFKKIGRWWSNKEIEMVEIDGKVYALDGWNGESYTNGWECTGEGYTDASEQQYSITPIYEDDELVAYEVD